MGRRARAGRRHIPDGGGWRTAGMAQCLKNRRATTTIRRNYRPVIGYSYLHTALDDHSRLLVDGRFFDRENARACQDLLRRAITRRGLPEVFYCDNGAPFSNAWLARTCGVLGIRLVHSRPYSPPLTGQSRLCPGIVRVIADLAIWQGFRDCPACHVDRLGSVRVTRVP